MSTEMDAGLPSIRIIQGMIRDKAQVDFQLVTNEKFSGHVRWVDPFYIGLEDASGQMMLISRSAIAYVKGQPAAKE